MKPALVVSLTALFVAAIAFGRGPRGPEANPFERYALARPFETRGVVVERVPAGSYLYVRLQNEVGAQSWVVTLARTAPVDNQVHVTVFAKADTFTSKRLHRTFEPLLFGVVRADSPTTQESP
jgi:hypothetical protein